MSKVLIVFIAIVFLAGYAVQPPEKTVPYKVTLRSGACGMAHRRVQRLHTVRLRDYYRDGRNSPRRRGSL